MKVLTMNRLLVTCALSLFCVLVTPVAAVAEAPTPEVKTQFDSKVRERNGLIRKLYRLDREAADALLRQQPTLQLNAKQQGLQDQLNVVELRLAIMSSRYDLEVPAPPVLDTPVGGKAPETNADRRRREVQELAPEGHARTRAVVRREVLALLAGLRYDNFPRDVKGAR